VAETAFAVTYDGPALADGRMPVRDLAPALLALGDLFTEASIVGRPDRQPPALEVKATEEGSFIVQLILQADGWDRVRDLLTSDTAQALAELRDWIIGGTTGATGLFALIKWLRGRHVKSQQSVAPGQVRLILDDETTIEVPTPVATLQQNIEVRKKARQVVEPLTRPGVERLEFRTERELTVRIDVTEVDAYEVSEEEELLGEQEVELVLEIASVAFTEGNKWRFADGENTFFATIEDPSFLERVELGIEAFRKGDMLRCRMRIVQSRRDGHLQIERQVMRVIEHLPRGEQMQLEEPE
jgi:hypothetical protein